MAESEKRIKKSNIMVDAFVKVTVLRHRLTED
jgi:hypothetical protein